MEQRQVAFRPNNEEREIKNQRRMERKKNQRAMNWWNVRIAPTLQTEPEV
jgi:hypothetical protein